MSRLPATFASVLQIANEGQAYKLHWPKSERLGKGCTVLCDVLTARAISTVHDALSSHDNKAKLRRMVALGPDKLAKIAAIAFKAA